jgi:hypothetical protein
MWYCENIAFSISHLYNRVLGPNLASATTHYFHIRPVYFFPTKSNELYTHHLRALYETVLSCSDNEFISRYDIFIYILAHHTHPSTHTYTYTYIYTHIAGEDVEGGDPGLLRRAPQAQAEGAHGGRMSGALAIRFVRLPYKSLHRTCPSLDARVPLLHR